MLKTLLAAAWLGFNLRSLLSVLVSKPSTIITEDKTSTFRTLMDLRASLGRGGQDLPGLIQRLHSDPEQLSQFRRALLLNVGGLVAELVLYFSVTLSFETWGALAFGALVIASHLHSITMLILLAVLVHNRNWFILTYKKLQVLVVPALVLEVAWLAYLVLNWTGFLNSLL